MFLLSRIEITFAWDERCFHEVSGVSPEVRAAWMGSRSSNGDPQLSNLDNETFARNRSSIVFHRTSAIRVSNFDRRRATWSWPFVFGDFPGLSKGGSLDFSRPNPPPHCSAHWIGEPNEVFSGDPLDPLNRYTHYYIMGRENFVIPRLLWKSHSKLSRNENFPILSYTFVPATLPLL